MPRPSFLSRLAKRLLPLMTSILTVYGVASAQESRFAIEGGVGTTGVSLEGQAPLHPRLAVRFGAHYFNYDSGEEDYDGISYEGDIELHNGAAFADLHPFANGFTVSGGVFFGNKELSISGFATEDTEIGDVVFTPEQIGFIDGTVDLGNTAPYFGIGWDNSLYRESRLGLTIRAGAMFTGSPDVALTARDGVLSEDPTFLAQLEIEEQNVQDDVDQFEIYPVVTVGLSYSFR